MFLNYEPHMWAQSIDLDTILRPYMAGIPHTSPVYQDAEVVISHFDAGNDDDGILAAQRLADEPECPEELRVALELSCAIVIADQGDLAAARMFASRAVTRGRHSLGSTHDLVLELRRWEVHWMTFTMMEDIAIKRYRALLADARKVWGECDPRYWRLRLESAIPLVFDRRMPALMKRMESIVRQIPTHTFEFRDLRANALLVLAQHYVDFGEADNAERTYQTLVDWCDTWADMIDEASGATSGDEASHCAKLQMLGRVLLSSLARATGDEAASFRWAQEAARTMPTDDLAPDAERMVEVLRGGRVPSARGVPTLAIP